MSCNRLRYTQQVRDLTAGARRYDTVGLFGRSLHDLTFVAKHSLNITQPGTYKSVSTRLLYPTDFFPLPDPEHQKLFESFIENLEAYLGVKRVEVNLAQLWMDKSHYESESGGLPLQEYMNKVSFLILALLRGWLPRDLSKRFQGALLVSMPRILSKLQEIPIRVPREVRPRTVSGGSFSS